jgi:hypothetical protein
MTDFAGRDTSASLGLRGPADADHAALIALPHSVASIESERASPFRRRGASGVVSSAGIARER